MRTDIDDDLSLTSTPDTSSIPRSKTGADIKGRLMARLEEEGLNDKTHPGCKRDQDTGAEDAEMGKCMESLQVREHLESRTR